MDLQKIKKLNIILDIILNKDTPNDTKRQILELHDMNNELKEHILKKPRKTKKYILDLENGIVLKNKIWHNYILNYLEITKNYLQRQYINSEFLIAEKNFKEKNKKEYVFPNQREAATKIINELLIKNKKAVSLVALPQVGKTGTFLFTAVLATTHKDDDKIIKPENVYIITGMSDKEWQTQTENDMIKIFKNNVFHHGRLNKFYNEIKKNYSKNETILIILDECHIATREGQEIDRIFQKIMNINTTKNIDDINNIKFINVSATPSAVLRAMNKWGEYNHKIVYIEPSNKYIGFNLFIEQNRLIDSDELTEDYLNEKILGIIKKRYNKDPKYHIFRCSTKSKIELIENFCKKNKFKFYEHNSDNRKDNFDDILKKIPEEHTFFVIKSFYRAGKRLCDKNIGIAYEHNSEVNYDITAQGLIGRFCGNDKNNMKKGSPFFLCNKETIGGYLDFIEKGCNFMEADYISRNFKIKDGKVIKESNTTFSRIIDPENEDNLIKENEFSDIPYIVNINTNQKWSDYIKYINNLNDIEKEKFIRKEIENNNIKIYDKIKDFIKYKISIPKESVKSYESHIIVAVQKNKDNQPFKKDIPKKYLYNNVWGCFIDYKNPRFIILIYRGEDLLKKIKKNKKIIAKSKKNNTNDEYDSDLNLEN